MKERIEKALDLARPGLQADGGDIEIVDILEEDGILQVRFLGMCSGCSMSQITLKEGVERIVKMQVPEIRMVEAV